MDDYEWRFLVIWFDREWIIVVIFGGGESGFFLCLSDGGEGCRLFGFFVLV